MRQLLLLTLLCFTMIASAQEGLVLGETVQISITADAPTLRQLEGHAGETLRFTVRAVDAGEATPDLVIWLVFDGQLLAYNDNQGESANPMIQLSLPQDGLYSLYIDSFNGVSVGEAEILVEMADPFNVIQSDNHLLIDLPAGQVFRYSFDASGDFTIRVKDLSGTLDPYLRLLNGAGELVAENDDHASNDFSLGLLDSRLSLRLDATVYTLEVRDFLGNAGQLEIRFD